MDENYVSDRNSSKKPKKKAKSKKGIGIVICIILMIVMLTASFLVFQDIIFKGATALADGYNATFTSEKDAAYQAVYQHYYDQAEAANHVANRMSIYIDKIRETNNLEVLKVRDVEFIIEDKNNKSGNITSWLEVPGEGTYVVDLSAGEFIVDNERSHVSVRLPDPELTNLSIDYDNVNKLLFKNDVFNESYKQGEELAMKQLNEASILIKKEFASNERFYQNAKKAAISTIQCMIKELNPNVKDLTIDIDFY